MPDIYKAEKISKTWLNYVCWVLRNDITNTCQQKAVTCKAEFRLIEARNANVTPTGKRILSRLPPPKMLIANRDVPKDKTANLKGTLLTLLKLWYTKNGQTPTLKRIITKNFRAEIVDEK